MIKNISIDHLGPISELRCNNIGTINLVIGPNQSGKTFLLKALFAALKTVEQYKRSKSIRSDKEILSDRLYWTFQTEALGNIVQKGQSMMSFSMKSESGKEFAYSFGPSTVKKVNIDKNSFPQTNSKTVFIPAKEIISIRDIILELKDDDRFGFEEPYSDLAKSLKPPYKGRNYKAFSDARQSVADMICGRLEYNESKEEWQFKDSKRRVYEINTTSEGVKKMAILDVLLGNHYLDNHSIIIIDEIEANLHPSMITRFLETIKMLADAGIQFFISSHSYFVIKRLYIMAHKYDMDIPVLSFDEGTCSMANLKVEMPKNAIIDESIALYRDEISL